MFYSCFENVLVAVNANASNKMQIEIATTYCRLLLCKLFWLRLSDIRYILDTAREGARGAAILFYTIYIAFCLQHRSELGVCSHSHWVFRGVPPLSTAVQGRFNKQAKGSWQIYPE